jgi:hypothetical protein
MLLEGAPLRRGGCQPCRWKSERGIGALDRIRTGDLILTKDALYQLSYEGVRVCLCFGPLF